MLSALVEVDYTPGPDIIDELVDRVVSGEVCAPAFVRRALLLLRWMPGSGSLTRPVPP